MKTRIRKEREFHQRESEFLDLARKMIADGGLVGFSMDRLAEATEYSKGTIYQHFASREDLLAALAVQSLTRRVKWFERAANFRGSSRQRIYAMTVAEEVFVTLQPLHFRCEFLIKLSDFADRATPERRAELIQAEEQCIGLLNSVANEAVQVGDLTLTAGRTVGEVLVGFIAIHIGMFTILHNMPQILDSLQIEDPLRTMRGQIVAYLDGLGWRPLSSESDPAAEFRRILTEVFPDEARQSARLA